MQYPHLTVPADSGPCPSQDLYSLNSPQCLSPSAPPQCHGIASLPAHQSCHHCPTDPNGASTLNLVSLFFFPSRPAKCQAWFNPMILFLFLGTWVSERSKTGNHYTVDWGHNQITDSPWAGHSSLPAVTFYTQLCLQSPHWIFKFLSLLDKPPHPSATLPTLSM